MWDSARVEMDIIQPSEGCGPGSIPGGQAIHTGFVAHHCAIFLSTLTLLHRLCEEFRFSAIGTPPIEVLPPGFTVI